MLLSDGSQTFLQTGRLESKRMVILATSVLWLRGSTGIDPGSSSLSYLR